MSEQDEILRLYRQLARLDDAVTLQRMKALGYWPGDQALPADPEPEAEERARIQAELAQMAGSAANADSAADALRIEHQRRWEQSKQRRAQRRSAREAAQQARREAWQAASAADVLHAGVGVSERLGDRVSHAQTLAVHGLPVLHDAQALAQALGITLGRLRWLTFHRRGATLVHYHHFGIAKKQGGMRAISAPKPALAQCQRWILEHILGRIPPSEQAHGFVAGRCSVSNARCHTGQALLVNLDLKDFFPSIGYPRVRGLFAALGYSGQVASLLALLCSEAPRVKGAIRGDPRQRVFHVALGERVLPQGACTSPAISNLLCRRMDARLAGLAAHHGFVYTRYADDLSFSGPGRDAAGALLGGVRRILRDEGFVEHPGKTRIMGQGRRQEVTGLVVNQGVGLKREDKRRLRALLHNVARDGLQAHNRDRHPDFAGYLRGWVAYAVMVDPASASTLYPALHKALHHPTSTHPRTDPWPRP